MTTGVPERTAADYVARIRSIEPVGDEFRVTVKIMQVLAPSPAAVRPGETAVFFVSRRDAGWSFMDTGPRKVAFAHFGTPKAMRAVLKEGRDEQANDWDLMMEWWSGFMKGREVRVVYHDRYAEPYRGRLSVWDWGKAPEETGTEFLARLRYVREWSAQRQENTPPTWVGQRWRIGTEVIRVIYDPAGNVYEGDVVEFAEYGDILPVTGILFLREGMEKDYRGVFRVIFYDKFENPYHGVADTVPW